MIQQTVPPAQGRASANERTSAEARKPGGCKEQLRELGLFNLQKRWLWETSWQPGVRGLLRGQSWDLHCGAWHKDKREWAEVKTTETRENDTLTMIKYWFVDPEGLWVPRPWKVSGSN